MKPLATLLPSLLRQCEASDPFTEQAVWALWKDIVGEPLARRTRPAKLRQSKLVVSVPSPAWKRQLCELQGEIISRLNQVLGITISRVEFRIDLTLEQLPQEGVSASPGRSSTSVNLPLQGIEDEELRACIQAAAATCLDRRK